MSYLSERTRNELIFGKKKSPTTKATELSNPFDVPISLYNTKTRSIEAIQKTCGKNFSMYVCGPTVYDRPHIGNLRSVVVFDILYRILSQKYAVFYTRNITDIDDKIFAAASQNYNGPLNDAVYRVTNESYESFRQAYVALNCLKPSVEPKVTENMTAIMNQIQTLLGNGNAYIKDGHILFANNSEYSVMTGRQYDNDMPTEQTNVEKRSPRDFVLWKPAKDGETSWGLYHRGKEYYGRPGWHIECTALAEYNCGQSFDLHGGGMDLKFPHHENEHQIVHAYCGRDMANMWVHNGLLEVDGQKMAKSLGNVIYIDDLLQKTNGYVIRLAMMMTHYSQPLNWTNNRLALAEVKLKKWLDKAEWPEVNLGPSLRRWNAEPEEFGYKAFVSCLCENMNVPGAIAVMDKMYSDGHFKALGNCLRFLGLWEGEKLVKLFNKNLIDQSEIQKMIEKRRDARAAKDFALADTIRQQLEDMGIKLFDTAEGTKWGV